MINFIKQIARLGIVLLLVGGCSETIRQDVYKFEVGDYVNESYDQSLSSVAEFLINLNEQLELNIEVDTIDVRVVETNNPEKGCSKIKASFLMMGENVEFVVNTGPWKHMLTPNDVVIGALARARRDLGCESNFYEVYIKSTGYFGDCPRVFYGSESDMKKFQLKEKAIYSGLGSRVWKRVPTTLVNIARDESDVQRLNEVWGQYRNNSGVFEREVKEDIHISLDPSEHFKDNPDELTSFVMKVLNDIFDERDLVVYFDDNHFGLDFYEGDLSKGWFNLDWELMSSEMSQLFVVESDKSSEDLQDVVQDAIENKRIRLVILSTNSGASLDFNGMTLIVKTNDRILHEELYGKYSRKPKKRVMGVLPKKKRALRPNQPSK